MNNEWFGYAGAIVLTAMSLPQFVRILRDRSAEGVSLGTWSLFALSGASWLSYGILTAAPAVIAGNVAFLGTTMLVVILLVHRQQGWPVVAAVAGPAALAGIGLGLLLNLPAAVSGWLGVVVGAATTMPQLVTSVRGRRAGLPSEVSKPTFALLAFGQGLWLTYGILLGDTAITVVNVIAVCVSLSVLIVEAGRSRAAEYS